MDRNIDPVCKTEVDPAKAKGEVEHGGKKYFFCSPECRDEFSRRPEEYARGRKKGGCCH